MNKKYINFDRFIFELTYEKIIDLNEFLSKMRKEFLDNNSLNKELLIAITVNNNEDIIEYCLKNYIFDVNSLYDNNETVLQIVSEASDFKYTNANNLLYYQYDNINTNIVDSWGNNPIWTAIFNKYLFRNKNKIKDYNLWIKDLYVKGFIPNERCLTYICEQNDIYLKKLFNLT